MELAEISRKAVELLLERKITVSLAESCTGGMIASALVDWPGVSEALLDGLADGLTLDELSWEKTEWDEEYGMFVRLLYERGKDAHAGRIGGNAG